MAQQHSLNAFILHHLLPCVHTLFEFLFYSIFFSHEHYNEATLSVLTTVVLCKMWIPPRPSCLQTHGVSQDHFSCKRWVPPPQDRFSCKRWVSPKTILLARGGFPLRPFCLQEVSSPKTVLKTIQSKDKLQHLKLKLSSLLIGNRNTDLICLG